MPKRPYTGKRTETGFKSKGEALTKQSFKDETDINRVLDRAVHGASLSHLTQHGGKYGDFSDFDENTYEAMLNRIGEAHTIFFDLPAELRSEFDNNAGKFFGFVNDAANTDRLEEIFPALAAPGRQMPDDPADPGPPDPPEPPAPPADPGPPT